MDNRTLADNLLKMAHSLESQHASLYRVQAYRRAAETILGLEQPVEEVIDASGRKGLAQLPGIGAKLSRQIETLVRAGDVPILTEDKTLVAK